MIKTANSKWIKNIHLPQNNPQLDGKFITMTSDALYSSNIHYDFGISVLRHGDTKCLENINGQWVDYSDLEYSRIRYGNNFWSLRLPSDIVRPGIVMKFTLAGMSGTLNNIAIGAPNELLVNTIDIGLLTPYRNEFLFQQETKYQHQYFQLTPASRLIVNQYEPITLEKMVLRDGTIYTMETGSKGEGTWHKGDIRDVGRKMITMGINNANYGIHSTSSEVEQVSKHFGGKVQLLQ